MAIGRMVMQGGGGLRGPVVVPQGGPVEVDVGPNDTEVVIVDPVLGEIGRARVPRGRKAHVPIPPVPPGTILFVRTGAGLRQRVFMVEVVEPS